MAEWAERRLRQLIEPTRIAAMMSEARTRIGERDHPTVWPTELERNNAWRVFVSVFPSADDDETAMLFVMQSVVANSLCIKRDLHRVADDNASSIGSRIFRPLSTPSSHHGVGHWPR